MWGGGDGKGVGGKLGLRGRGTRYPTWNIKYRLQRITVVKQSHDHIGSVEGGCQLK